MKNELNLKPVSIAIGAIVGTVGMAGVASADENPFTADSMDAGYMLAGADKAKEGKCGEGKCGGDKDAKADKEGKCGEGKC
ncbi:MAG: low-complexity protein, partial [Proteobacteria bacterium]|nr:low-complexity protein [Pseudomonadota bacterium]